MEKDKVYVGVVGYSDKKFDKEKARKYISNFFDNLKKVLEEAEKEVVIVSGLTSLGIPLIAYEEADKRGWKTVGIACEKANEFSFYDVDEKVIEGKDWGDESKTFLDSIQILLRVGGGKQSKEETKLAKELGKKVYEYELEVLEN